MENRWREETAGIVLAGGRGSRMGEVEKGLLPFCGRPLLSYAIEALRPLCRELYLNANRALSRYREFGLPVLPDPIPGFAGPLAGVLAGLEAATTPYLLVLPCDAPAITSEIPVQLLEALIAQGAEIALASDGERCHPVVMALLTSLRGDLRRYLEAGGRKIDRWTERHRTVVVPFERERFFNLNTKEELAELERRWQDRRSS